MRVDMANHLYCPEGEARVTAAALACGKPDFELITKLWHEHLRDCGQCASTHQVIEDRDFRDIVARVRERL